MERRPDDEHQADDGEAAVERENEANGDELADAGEAGERAATPDELEQAAPDGGRDHEADGG